MGAAAAQLGRYNAWGVADDGWGSAAGIAARPSLDAGLHGADKPELSSLRSASVIALVGLAFEARIAAGPGVLVICQTPGRDTTDMLRLAVHHGCRSIISFGVAGGLAPDLRPGDCVVASAIVEGSATRPTSASWSRKLLEAIPDVRHGKIAGVSSVVAHPVDKRKLHAVTGAMAVDMESHLVASFAMSHGLAFAAVRVIVDPADRLVPPAAMLAMGRKGRVEIRRMLAEIIAEPSQLGVLIRIAADAYAARSTLVRLRQMLGPRFSWTAR